MLENCKMLCRQKTMTNDYLDILNIDKVIAVTKMLAKSGAQKVKYA